MPRASFLSKCPTESSLCCFSAAPVDSAGILGQTIGLGGGVLPLPSHRVPRPLSMFRRPPPLKPRGERKVSCQVALVLCPSW
jgi:hypothetical protein